MQREDEIRIAHILEAGEAVARFLSGRRRADLDNDQMLSFALVRAIEVVGEAASKISCETRASLPVVPWAAIVAMRNRLIHAYFDIDADILWRTVTEELPELAKLLRRLTGGGGGSQHSV